MTSLLCGCFFGKAPMLVTAGAGFLFLHHSKFARFPHMLPCDNIIFNLLQSTFNPPIQYFSVNFPNTVKNT